MPDWLRRPVAWLGHAPGLWLFYREKLTRRLARWNVIAVVLTLGAIAIAAALGDRPVWFAFVAWIVGHIAWGTLLALALPPRHE